MVDRNVLYTEINLIIEVVVATTDSHTVVTFPNMNVTQMSDTGEMVIEMVEVIVAVIMAEEISFCQQTTTIVFIMPDFKTVRVVMLLHRNTVDSQMTGSHITNLILATSHSQYN